MEITNFEYWLLCRLRQIIDSKCGTSKLEEHSCITGNEYRVKYKFKDVGKKDEEAYAFTQTPKFGTVKECKFAYSSPTNKSYVFCLYYLAFRGDIFYDVLSCEWNEDGSYSFVKYERPMRVLYDTDLPYISKPFNSLSKAIDRALKAQRKHYENIVKTYQETFDNMPKMIDKLESEFEQKEEIKWSYPSKQELIDDFLVPCLRLEMNETLESFNLYKGK